MKYIFHIGRNDNLAVAELISVFGLNSIESIFGSYVMINSDEELSQKTIDKLGGTVSIYRVLTKASDFYEDSFFDHVKYRFENSKGSKMSIAIESNFLEKKYIDQMLKKLKVFVKNAGFSFRYLMQVSTAALLGSGFLKGKVQAYKVLKFKDDIYVTELVGLQNIDSYSFRDRSKPYRDAKLGMLPPKLSQIMINLAVDININNSGAIESIYDPFCGTGTILMEAALQGRQVAGSDIAEVNVDGTEKNLSWLAEKYDLDIDYRIFKRDSRKIVADDLSSVQAIVTEGYLGEPKRGNESRESLLNELVKLEQLYFDFFEAVSKAADSPLTVVICLPVYTYEKDNLYMENLVEKLAQLGYSVSALVPSGNNLHLKAKDSVLYKRESQMVYRQILRLQLTP